MSKRVAGYYWVALPDNYKVKSKIELALYDPKDKYGKWTIIGQEEKFDDYFFKKIGSTLIELPKKVF